jgi:hypothetical protein
MNKFFVAIGLCTLGLGHESLAAASDSANFYNFDKLDINGGGKLLAVRLVCWPTRPVFKLKKSLRPALWASVDDPALK